MTQIQIYRMCVKHEQDGAVFSSKAVEECNLGTNFVNKQPKLK